MFRFKLRTLLIAIALVGLFLGLQVHVHMKAKRFVEEMKNASKETRDRLVVDAEIDSPVTFWTVVGRHSNTKAFVHSVSIADILLLRRRCKVEFIVEFKPGPYEFHAERYVHQYRASIFADGCQLDCVSAFQID